MLEKVALSDELEERLIEFAVKIIGIAVTASIRTARSRISASASDDN